MATGDQARRAADLHADVLSAYPNVVGIGTRPVDDARAAGGDAHAVAVYVSRKIPADLLAAGQRLPDHVELRDASGLQQVPVVVVETGAIAPEGDAAAESDRGFTSE